MKLKKKKTKPLTLAEITDNRERSLLETLRDHLSKADVTLWEAGDIINTLKHDYPDREYTTAKIIKMLGLKWKRNRLDEIAKTARAFPKKQRDSELTISDHLVARKAAERTSYGVSQKFGEREEPKYDKALKEVAKFKGEQGKHQTRDLTRNLLEVERRMREPKRRAQVAKLSNANKTVIESMYHGSCVGLMAKVAKRSVAVVHLDPPYANYSKTADGVLFPHSTSKVSCDNNDHVNAIEVTIEALRAAVELPKEDGVILLWQNSRRIPTRIAEALDELNLVDHPFLIYDKERSVLGDPSSGVMFSTEVCYVLTRKGEKALGHNMTQREQIIRGPENGNGARLNHRASNFEPYHQMQKPDFVNEDLLRRFTSEGDIVLDAFGCSASMCLAAQRMGRRWMYSESNPENYALGKRNMENFMFTQAQAKSA